MNITTENITSLDQECFSQDDQFQESDSIATETQPAEDPKWKICFDSLLKLMSNGPVADDGFTSAPNKVAIEAALYCLSVLRARYPAAPPTCVSLEPAGGIIVERRILTSSGRDCIFELTFYNDGRAERTDYVDGRIRRMNALPSRITSLRSLLL